MLDAPVAREEGTRRGFPLRLKLPSDGGVALARGLLIGVLVTVLPSTTLGEVFEFATYIAFAVSPELRRRLARTIHHPLMTGFLPFAAIIVIATFYGAASWHDAISSLIGWRRLALLPLALAVFDDAAAKRLVNAALVAICLAGTLVAFYVVAAGLPYLTGYGVVFHTYATQGIALSLAVASCVAALMCPQAFAGDRLLGDRRILVAAIALLAIDVVFVLPGRSGYVMLIVMPVVVVTLLARGSWRGKALTGLGVLVCVGILLASSSHVRDRLEQAINEIETVDHQAELTSLGQRVISWRYSSRMIADHPVFGVGTGGYQDGYRPYVQGVSGWQGHETGDPHNQFIKILGEQGLIGLVAFLFFIFRALTCPAEAPFRQLAVAAMIGWCATSLANSHFSTFAEGRLLFFWLGAMLAGPAPGNRETPAPR